MRGLSRAVLSLALAACTPRPPVLPPENVDISGVDDGAAFSLSPNVEQPTRFALAQGESTRFTIEIARAERYPDLPVFASLVDPPAGISAQGNISPKTSSGTLYMAASEMVMTGDYDTTLRFSGVTTAVDLPVVITVVPGGSVYGFRFSSRPAAMTLAQGKNVTASLSIERTAAATGPIAVALEGLPAGISAALAPSVISGSDAVLTLTDTGSALPGVSNVTLRATLSGFADAVAPLTVTVTPRQVLDFTVVDTDGNPTAGAQIIVDGVMAPGTDENGKSTLVRAVPRGTTYTVALLGTSFSSGLAVAVYQDIARPDPVFLRPEQPAAPPMGRYAVHAVAATPAGTLTYVSADEAVAKRTIAYLQFGATRPGDGRHLGAGSLGSETYDSAHVIVSGNVLPDDWESPFGSYTLLGGEPGFSFAGFPGITVPDSEPSYHADVSMLAIAFQDGLGGTSGLVDTLRGWKPESYRLFGRCRLSSIPNRADGFPGQLVIAADTIYGGYSHQRCDGFAHDGVPVEDVTAETELASLTPSIPPGYTFDERRLVLKSSSDHWTLSVSSDCFDGDDADCTAPAEFTSVDYVIPSGASAVTGFKDIHAVARVRARDGLGASTFASFRLGSTTEVSLPSAPSPVAPPNASVDVSFGVTFELAANGFSGRVMAVRAIAPSPLFAIVCYSATATCTLPAWLGMFTTHALPPSTLFYWFVNADAGTAATMDELTSAPVRHAVFHIPAEFIDTEQPLSTYGVSAFRTFTTAP